MRLIFFGELHSKFPFLRYSIAAGGIRTLVAQPPLIFKPTYFRISQFNLPGIQNVFRGVYRV